MNQKKAIIAAIDELAEKKFGWNGADALPIRRDSQHLVGQILSDEYTKVGYLDLCNKVGAAILGTGEIEIQLKCGDRGLNVLFHCGDAFSYIKTFADGETTVEGVVRIDGHRDTTHAIYSLNDLLQWVTGGKS